VTDTEYLRLVEFLGDKFAAVDRRSRRLERLEQECRVILQGVRRTEARLVDEQIRREVLGRRVDELERRLEILQPLIQELEPRLPD
jgi:chromosome segregation ATPase